MRELGDDEEQHLWDSGLEKCARDKSLKTLCTVLRNLSMKVLATKRARDDHSSVSE